ncbi:MAG: hypothetical protein K2Y21_04645 [Phycisphaerales bacterium]|nr:hypothetical protein [Phycisphaerales bacterium]
MPQVESRDNFIPTDHERRVLLGLLQSPQESLPKPSTKQPKANCYSNVMRSCRAFLCVHPLIAAALSLTLAARVAQPAPPPPSSFVTTVQKHFPAWDTDASGTLSLSEVEAASEDPNRTGDEAAALGAVRLVYRTIQVEPPALAVLVGEVPSSIEWEKAFAEARARVENLRPQMWMGPLPSLEQIRMGEFGNSAFVALAAGLAHKNPTQMKANFISRGQGVYQVMLPDHQIQVPPLTTAQIAGSSTLGTEGLWMAVLEKAVDIACKKAGATIVGDGTTGSCADAAAALFKVYFNPNFQESIFASTKGKDMKPLTSEKVSDKDQFIWTNLRFATAQDAPAIAMTYADNAVPGLKSVSWVVSISQETSKYTARFWDPRGGDFTPNGPPSLTNGYEIKKGYFSVPGIFIAGVFDVVLSPPDKWFTPGERKPK